MAKGTICLLLLGTFVMLAKAVSVQDGTNSATIQDSADGKRPVYLQSQSIFNK